MGSLVFPLLVLLFPLTLPLALIRRRCCGSCRKRWKPAR